MRYRWRTAREDFPKASGDRSKSVPAIVPFARVRRMADYWALRGVEEDHVRHLSGTWELNRKQGESLQAFWLGWIDSELEPRMVMFHERRRQAHRRGRGWRLRPNFVFQLWFNTIGPGGRTWFGNRYGGIRQYTFRLRWRP